MPIGNSPDIPSYNKEEDKRIKLAEKIDEWWNSLEDNEQFELLEPYYPDELHLMEMDEAWESISWNDKLDIFRELKWL